MDSIKLLVSFVETLNPQLGNQMRMVGPLARQVAEALDLEATQLEHIEMAGRIHDIGLLALPKDLQGKDVKLMTESQYRSYCEHPVIASITLEGVENMAAIAEIVLFHHEHMNGKGFPNALSGDQIPMGSRIILAVSDYCRIMTTWPRDMRKLTNYARRYLDPDDWKRFTVSDDPEDIVESSALKILLKDPEEKYDAQVIKALLAVIHKDKNLDPPAVVEVDELEAGMVLMEDLHLKGGRLLLTKNSKLQPKTVESIQNMSMRGMITHKIYVSVPAH